MAPAKTAIAATKKKTWLNAGFRGRSLAVPSQRRAVEGLGEQHLLGEDEVGAVIVRHLVVVAHRDRVERARDLAVAAEDAAREVDLVDRRVAFARRHAVLWRVLRGHHTDAVRRAGGGAQRAADALLQPGVLEAMQLVAPAEARVDRHLLLGVLDRLRLLDELLERRAQAAQRLAEGAVGVPGRPRLRGAQDLDGLSGVVGHWLSITTTTIAVTRALSVASGSRIFQPNDISWS